MLKRFYISVFALLFSLFLYIPAYSSNNEELLLVLSERGDLEGVKKVIANGVDVNATDKNSYTALIKTLTSPYFNPEVMRTLIKAGADVNVKGNDGFTPVMAAAYLVKNPDIINELIKAGANVNAKLNDGQTALMFAMNRYDSNYKIIKTLIDAGANVNAKEEKGVTVLMMAADYQPTQIIKELIRAGANVNLKDRAGFTALIRAASGNTDQNVIVALVKAGADLTVKNNEGNTALIQALAFNKNFLVAKILIQLGADVNVRNFYEQTALMLSVQRPDPTVTTELLKAGANINAKDKNGNTALMLAMGHYSDTFLYSDDEYQEDQPKEANVSLFIKPKVITTLIEFGADITLRNKNGYTALDIAKLKNNTQAVEFLTKAGAK
ncbi:ankyrin repeat domain-containing protein [Desulfovibrio litoralis]|uniref:Ankyrin repeat n=1 Tax=Desulfovibrio litoralis DSM 11393 TaxID=1121455 RepID=A0A1M7T2Q6_9BACT|nr:ankyrin repeat domain-containing protein [Desulfovibrio litoralis]SHN64942.1 Ankyrin repeat [Desulfovibrio litoralis DSM 11393]